MDDVAAGVTATLATDQTYAQTVPFVDDVAALARRRILCDDQHVKVTAAWVDGRSCDQLPESPQLAVMHKYDQRKIIPVKDQPSVYTGDHVLISLLW